MTPWILFGQYQMHLFLLYTNHTMRHTKTHAGSQRTPPFACLIFSLVGFQNAEQQIFTPNLSYTLKLLRHPEKNFTGDQGQGKA